MIKFCDCDYCKNKQGVKNGRIFCPAYPDGIPYPEFIDTSKKKTCGNGYKFEGRTEEPFKWYGDTNG